MSVKRDSTNGIATDAPYYDTKKRNIDSKIVKDLTGVLSHRNILSCKRHILSVCDILESCYLCLSVLWSDQNDFVLKKILNGVFLSQFFLCEGIHLFICC